MLPRCSMYNMGFKQSLTTILMFLVGRFKRFPFPSWESYFNMSTFVTSRKKLVQFNVKHVETISQKSSLNYMFYTAMQAVVIFILVGKRTGELSHPIHQTLQDCYPRYCVIATILGQSLQRGALTSGQS